jgi:hypothetical protein
MIYGTHNSGTGGKLVWWQRPLGWFINLVSQCQDRSITQQLEDGIRWFNLQFAFVGGKWKFTHGLAIYQEDLIETIAIMKTYATKENPIYAQLYLDRCFWVKNTHEQFLEIVRDIEDKFCDDTFIIHSIWNEREDRRISPKSIKSIKSAVEHYWTMGWVKSTKPKNLLDRLPLPKYHAKKYNKQYKANNKHKYLMLDFYELT